MENQLMDRIAVVNGQNVVKLIGGKDAQSCLDGQRHAAAVRRKEQIGKDAVKEAVERIGVSALRKRFDDKRIRKETLSELKKFVDENNLNFEAALATLHLRNSRVQTATFSYYRKDLTRDGKPESN
jgi:hypothetical protein